MDNYNGFPATYQSNIQPNLYYQPTQTTPIYSPRSWQQYYQQPTSTVNYQQQSNVNTAMIWVQGESGAKSYVLPNNTTLPLWDSESQTIYIKTVDQNGKPSMTILDYIERSEKENDKQIVSEVEYATKEQIDKLNEQFSIINEKLNSMAKFVTTDQLTDLNNHINNLGEQIEEIENRITSFGKPQSNNNNRRGNK